MCTCILNHRNVGRKKSLEVSSPTFSLERDYQYLRTIDRLDSNTKAFGRY